MYFFCNDPWNAHKLFLIVARAGMIGRVPCVKHAFFTLITYTLLLTNRLHKIAFVCRTLLARRGWLFEITTNAWFVVSSVTLVSHLWREHRYQSMHFDFFIHMWAITDAFPRKVLHYRRDKLFASKKPTICCTISRRSPGFKLRMTAKHNRMSADKSLHPMHSFQSHVVFSSTWEPIVYN